MNAFKNNNERKNTKSELTDNSNFGLRKLLNNFQGVLQEELPAGLTPFRYLDHKIYFWENQGKACKEWMLH